MIINTNQTANIRQTQSLCTPENLEITIPQDDRIFEISFNVHEKPLFPRIPKHKQKDKMPPMPFPPQKVVINSDNISIDNIKQDEITTDSVSAQFPVGINNLDLSPIKDFVLKKIADFNDEYKEGYSLNITYELYPSEGYVGVLFKILTDTKGAHPTTDIHTFTIDQFGIRPSIHFDDYQKISDISKATLKPQLESEDMYMQDIFEEGLAPTAENFKYVIEQKDSYIFFFPQYQVAPYAAGIRQVEIPKSELK